MELRKAIEDAGPHGKGKTSDGSWGFKVTDDEVVFYFHDKQEDAIPRGLFDDDTWEVVTEQIEVSEGDWIKREGVYCRELSTRGCKVVGITDARIALATDRLLCTCHFPKWYEHTLISKGPSKPMEIDMGQVEVSGNGRYFTVPPLPLAAPDGRYNVTLRPVEDSQ